MLHRGKWNVQIHIKTSVVCLAGTLLAKQIQVCVRVRVQHVNKIVYAGCSHEMMYSCRLSDWLFVTM